MAQQVKDLASSLLWRGFEPWPEKFPKIEKGAKHLWCVCTSCGGGCNFNLSGGKDLTEKEKGL